MTTTSAQKLRGACEVVVATTLSYGFDWTFHNPLCGLLFQCGCTWNCGPWSGAACRGGWDDCNVHNARKPWCPWCRAPQDHPAWAWTVSDPFTVALMATAFVGVRFRLFDRCRHRIRARSCRRRCHRRRRLLLFHGQAGLQAQGLEDGAEDGEDEEENKLRQLSASPERLPEDGSSGAALSSEPRAPLLVDDDGLADDGPTSPSPSPAADGDERRRFFTAAGSAVAAFLAWDTLMGVVFWLATDYPYFLFFEK